jgi:hypothetical protein
MTFKMTLKIRMLAIVTILLQRSSRLRTLVVVVIALVAGRVRKSEERRSLCLIHCSLGSPGCSIKTKHKMLKVTNIMKRKTTPGLSKNN